MEVPERRELGHGRIEDVERIKRALEHSVWRHWDLVRQKMRDASNIRRAMRGEHLLPRHMAKGCRRIGNFEFSEIPRHQQTRWPRRFDYPADLDDVAVPLVAAAKRLCTYLSKHVYGQHFLCTSRGQHFFLYTKGHGSEGARYGNGFWVELPPGEWKMMHAPDEWPLLSRSQPHTGLDLATRRGRMDSVLDGYLTRLPKHRQCGMMLLWRLEMDIYLGKKREGGERATINLRMGRRRAGFRSDEAWCTAWEEIKSGCHAATIVVDLRNYMVVATEGDAFGLFVAHMMDMPVDGYTALLGLVEDEAPVLEPRSQTCRAWLASGGRGWPASLAPPLGMPPPPVVTFGRWRRWRRARAEERERERRFITPMHGLHPCRGTASYPDLYPDVLECHALLKIRFVSGGTQPGCQALGGPDSWVPLFLWQGHRWASLAGALIDERRRRDRAEALGALSGENLARSGGHRTKGSSSS
jgi:hypothetical protein